IFERFYRADQARSDKEHFGLGLSIAEELSRLHHGSLRVVKTGVNGTTFELKLPTG
ncbi:MAG: ATP-binding protein, partial [Clostridia bacterium]|nr:ATP-binding protein [Clostridia bacterium]